MKALAVVLSELLFVLAVLLIVAAIILARPEVQVGIKALEALIGGGS